MAKEKVMGVILLMRQASIVAIASCTSLPSKG